VVAIVVQRIPLDRTQTARQIDEQHRATASQPRHRSMDLEAVLVRHEAVLERHMRPAPLGVKAQRRRSLPGVYDEPEGVGTWLEVPIVERHGIAGRQNQAMAQERVALGHELYRPSRVAGGERLVLQKLGGPEQAAASTEP